MEIDELYELVADAIREGFRDEAGGGEARISPRLLEGRVIFEDGQGKQFKEVPAAVVFRKITAVREKLRVLEQRVNNHGALSASDKVELQAYVTRAYGSLTTFNFMFRDEDDKFRGSSD
ncbi:MAG: hypothetical protein R3F61_05255 [Myxococcota bacterium]